MVLERPATEERVASSSPECKEHASLPEEESHKKPRGEVARSSTSTPAEIADAAANQSVVETPVPAEDDLVIDVMMVDGGGGLPDGWKCVDGALELETTTWFSSEGMKSTRNFFHLKNELTDFVAAERKELENYFAFFVWEFASDKEKKDAEKDQRVVTARLVMTWKREDENAEAPKWKAKASLVLRGYEDPDDTQQSLTDGIKTGKAMVVNFDKVEQLAIDLCRREGSVSVGKQLHQSRHSPTSC